MDIHTYFEELGLNKKETDIFIALYRLGKQPASILASHLGMERTYVYKVLVKLTSLGFILETVSGGIKHFFIEELSVIQKNIEKQKKKFEHMNAEFQELEEEFQKMNHQSVSGTVQFNVFDGISGIENIYNNMLEEIAKNNYISIKLFTSNTLESSAIISESLQKISHNFLDNLKSRGVHIHAYLGNGIRLMENLSHVDDIEVLKNIPAGSSVTNIYTIGKITYILIFKDKPFGIKIDNEDLGDAMHFIFENLS